VLQEKNLSGYAKIVVRPLLLNKLRVSPFPPLVSARIPQVSTATSSAPLACIIVSIPAPAADF
jgi:hypothetical protein